MSKPLSKFTFTFNAKVPEVVSTAARTILAKLVTDTGNTLADATVQHLGSFEAAVNAVYR